MRDTPRKNKSRIEDYGRNASFQTIQELNRTRFLSGLVWFIAPTYFYFLEDNCPAEFQAEEERARLFSFLELVKPELAQITLLRTRLTTPPVLFLPKQ